MFTEYFLGPRSLPDAPVIESVGQADECGCEPVAPDVGRLPCVLTVHALCRLLIDRHAELPAALVVLAVRAYEKNWLSWPGRSVFYNRINVLIEQVFVSAERDF